MFYTDSEIKAEVIELNDANAASVEALEESAERAWDDFNACMSELYALEEEEQQYLEWNGELRDWVYRDDVPRDVVLDFGRRYSHILDKIENVEILARYRAA